LEDKIMAKTLHGDRMAGFKLPINLGDLASGATNTTQEVARFCAPHDMKLAAAYAILIAALTGAATNFANFNIVNKSTDASGTTIMASLAFNTTGITVAAKAPAAFTLSTTAANLLISEGDVIAIAAVGGGAGAVYPIGNFSGHFTMQ
jgi:hypothetical protein